MLTQTVLGNYMESFFGYGRWSASIWFIGIEEAGGVSGHSKPATKGRMKTSHFEGSIAYWAAWAALERNERTQRELAAFDIGFGGQRLVQPADCA